MDSDVRERNLFTVFMCVAGEWMINGEYKIKKKDKLSENIVDKR